MWRGADRNTVPDRQQVAEKESCHNSNRHLQSSPLSMSSQFPSSSRLRRTSRVAVASIALIAATWCIVLTWWHVTQRVITTSDTLVYLIALPVLLVLSLGILAWRASSKQSAAKAESPTSEMPDAVPIPSAGFLPAANLPILGTWSATPLSYTAGGFIESLAERRRRPVPDEFLTDGNGFPVLSGRTRDLDTTFVEENLRQILRIELAENAHEEAEEELRDAVIRALTLLDSVVEQALQEWPSELIDENGSDAAPASSIPILRGSAGIRPPSGKALQLRVTLLVADDLSPPEHLLIQKFLVSRITSLQHAVQDLTVEVMPACDDARALTLSEDFRRATQDDDRPRALLLLACDSLLCANVVENLESKGKLFDAERPNGLMIGEAAFGVLFANQSALVTATVQPLCHLTPVQRVQREAPVDARVRTSFLHLARTVEAALKASGIPANQIGTVVCDADHRANRVLESIEAIAAHAPQLDAIQNRLAPNEACGHLGAASVLGVLSAGISQCVDAGHPVLVFNVGHDTDRAATLLLPANGFHAESDSQHSQAV